jgi:hypothetical protein
VAGTHQAAKCKRDNLNHGGATAIV